MSQRPISRSRDLKRLRDEGYSVEVRGGFLVVPHLPYLNAAKQVRRGVLVCKLDLSDDVAGKPEDHTAYFAGEYPCNADGTPIEKIRLNSETKTLLERLTVHHQFSAKPKPITRTRTSTRRW